MDALFDVMLIGATPMLLAAVLLLACLLALHVQKRGKAHRMSLAEGRQTNSGANTWDGVTTGAPTQGPSTVDSDSR